MKHKDIILQLRAEGKTYDEIRQITGASKGTISYHCGEGQKEKYSKRLKKSRSIRHPFCGKLESFITPQKGRVKHSKNTDLLKNRLKLKIEKFHRNRRKKDRDMYVKPTFSIQDVINKFGENPRCYLTGKEIDIYKTSSYHFDHIIPVSKGGESTLDNLEICTRDANQAKHDMLLDDFFLLCRQVLEENGYTVKDK